MASFSITTEQRDKWIHNSLVFLAPLMIIYLTEVTQSLQQGFDWSAFIPNPGVLALYLANIATDFFRKYIPNN